MANTGSVTNRKFCVKCDGTKSSGSGLFTCDGCQQMFCSRHVGEHREELGLQLENIAQEHDLIQQECSQPTVDRPIFEKIDAWEQMLIRKIQQLAKQLRADCHRLFQGATESVKQDCSELAKHLRRAREQDDYAESDLKAWRQTLATLRTHLGAMEKIDIVPDQRSTINMIRIQHNMDWLEDASSPRYARVGRTEEIYQRPRRATNRSPEDPPLSAFRRVGPIEPEDNADKPTQCRQQ